MYCVCSMGFCSCSFAFVVAVVVAVVTSFSLRFFLSVLLFRFIQFRFASSYFSKCMIIVMRTQNGCGSSGEVM